MNMKVLSKPLICLLFALQLSINAYGGDDSVVDKAKLFDGIVEQSHDYSCGTAALATLMHGIGNSQVTEEALIKSIDPNHAKDKGYSLRELESAAVKQGYMAGFRKISKTELPKAKLPVVLLIGKNSDFPHYVVLKGVVNNIAFLADPMRGNIRIEYPILTHEGLSDKYPAWYVLAVEPPINKPGHSTLYLSDSETERLKNHLTEEQSSAITTITLPRSNQYFLGYGFNAALGGKHDNSSYSHALIAQYGVTDDLEVGLSFQHDDNYANLNGNSINYNDETYGLFLNKRFGLDDAGKYSVIIGVSTAYASQNDVLGGAINITGYRNSEFGQFIIGGSVGKSFSTQKDVDESLPEFSYSGFVGINKPLFDRYLGSVIFSVDDSKTKSRTVESQRSYTVATGLSYVVNKNFQVRPNFSYSFGSDEIFSFGFDINYLGNW
jgi:predicted double-glycine peptidase